MSIFNARGKFIMDKTKKRQKIQAYATAITMRFERTDKCEKHRKYFCKRTCGTCGRQQSDVLSALPRPLRYA